MVVKLANNASSTLAGAINSSVTSLSVASGDASKFPSLGAGEWFPLTVVDSAGNMEIMRVTARSGATLTVTRGQEGTTAKSFAAGAKCDLRLTAASQADHEHSMSAIQGLATALGLKADDIEITAIYEALALKANVSDLTSGLAAKANQATTYTKSEVDALVEAAGSAPAGTIIMVARNTAPTGFLKANGAAVSRATYSELFAAIGTTFGAGNGSSTFNLPDLRGEFVRGWDDARGVDSGRVFGSAQASQNLSHTHTGTADSGGAHTHDVPIATNSTGSGRFQAGGSGSAGTPTTSSGAHTHSLTINANGGTEARPRNVALLYCIKF